MKKILFGGLFLSALCTNAIGALPWWMQPTICKPNTSNCYASLGVGFDAGMWDATGNCWGLKLICSNATTANDSEPVAMGKSSVLSGLGIIPDFDTGVLNGDCFGARKTSNGGSMASVNGAFVNVWCTGVLVNPDEVLATGEITFGAAPTCSSLATNGYVATLNQKCYGKYYNPNNYYIECESTNIKPKRLIELNGASPIIGTSATTTNYPTDITAAKNLFDKMYETSTANRAKYF